MDVPTEIFISRFLPLSKNERRKLLMSYIQTQDVDRNVVEELLFRYFPRDNTGLEKEYLTEDRLKLLKLLHLDWTEVKEIGYSEWKSQVIAEIEGLDYIPSYIIDRCNEFNINFDINNSKISTPFTQVIWNYKSELNKALDIKYTLPFTVNGDEISGKFSNKEDLLKNSHEQVEYILDEKQPFEEPPKITEEAEIKSNKYSSTLLYIALIILIVLALIYVKWNTISHYVFSKDSGVKGTFHRKV